jgi:actin-related protein
VIRTLKEIFSKVLYLQEEALCLKRMKKEIQALAPSPMEPKVDAPADRKFSCWLGGAILSKIQSFDAIWITK